MSSIDRLLGLVTAVAIKAPCRVATTANITLSGLQTVDGVALAAGDRVLVKDQTNAVLNGIWNADTGNWTRAVDFNGTGDVAQGTLVRVTSGTANALALFELQTASPVIGTSELTIAGAFLPNAIGPQEAVVRNGMTGAQIAALADLYSTLWFVEPISLSDTLDLTGKVGLTLISLISGKPLITSTATVGIRVGGQVGDTHGDFQSETHAPWFKGEWWITYSGSRVHSTRAVVVEENTYRLHFEALYGDNWGGVIQGTKGDIRTVIIDRFFPYNFVAFGAEFFSTDPLKEVDDIRIGKWGANSDDADAEGTYYSIGCSLGSGGKIGGYVGQGIGYRQGLLAKMWAVRKVVSAVWSGGVTTYTLLDYHSLSEGDDVYFGGFDTSGYNNLTSTPWTAAAGTDGKVIKVAMSDPGSYTTVGYFTYNYRIYNSGYNNYEQPRKFKFAECSGRGQRLGGFRGEGGTVEFDGFIIDDAGTNDPNGLYCTYTWSGGVITFKTWEDDGVTPADHDLSLSDQFSTRYFNPSAATGSWTAASVPDTQTVTATLTDDPGAMTKHGSYYKPVSLDTHGIYFGPNFGDYSLKNFELHENNGAGIYDERLGADRVSIADGRIYNQSFALPGHSPGMYFLPGAANVSIKRVKSGAGDTWRFADNGWTFSGQPTAGEYVFVGLNDTVEPTFFIFDTVSDPDASQPSVLIGATYADTLQNLFNSIVGRDDDNCNGIRPYIDGSTLWCVRTVRGDVGNDYVFGESASNITLAKSGATLHGGTGQPTQSYGAMNVQNGVRGCVIEECDFSSNITGESNLDPPAEAAVTQPNLLDNGDFSLDQDNEGVAATLTSVSAKVRIVDRWQGTRSTANVTAQRVAGDVQTYGLRINGGASNTAVVVSQCLEGARSAALEGEPLVFSAWVHSPDLVKCSLRLATADVLDDFSAVTTIKLKQFVIGPDPVRVSFVTLGTAGCANGLEASFRFTDGVTAGQTVTIEGAKLEMSGVITDFLAPEPDNNLFACRRYLRKSFPAGTAPAQNAGTTGAVVGTQSIAGANAQQFQTVEFNPPMRIAPTVTLYNPSATNAQIRNTTAGADWSSSAAASISATGMTINGTGPGGGSAGDASAVHYKADAGL